MNKMLAVFKREYLATVRKKMFIIMTILFPALMAGLFFIPVMMISKSLGGKRVAVVDGSGRLHEAFAAPLKPEAVDPKQSLRDQRRARELPQTVNVDYKDAHAEADLQAAAKPYFSKLTDDNHGKHIYDAVLIVPSDAFTSDKAKMTFYSRSATDIFTEERLAGAANRAIQRQRLADRGLKGEEAEAIMARIPVESVQLSRSGEQKKGGDANFMVGFLLAALLLIPSFVYGVEVMRGIIQEKTDRVIEVLISSMTPTQLLVGKILGIAAVGLTQITAWLTIAAVGAAFGGAVAAAAGVNVSQFIRPGVFIYFYLFFVLGYLINVCVYAVAGAACNSDKEAQQLVMPIQMVMMLPWFVMMPIITNPDSSMAVGFSLSPVFAPITMFVRTLVSEPPAWHIATAVAVSLATVAVFFWATSKIFRVGILSYGKRPTIQELWRWMKVA